MKVPKIRAVNRRGILDEKAKLGNVQGATGAGAASCDGGAGSGAGAGEWNAKEESVEIVDLRWDNRLDVRNLDGTGVEVKDAGGRPQSVVLVLP